MIAVRFTTSVAALVMLSPIARGQGDPPAVQQQKLEDVVVYGARTSDSLLDTQTALHYGSFGGWLAKIAYVVLGVAMTIVTSSGVTIWLARWSDKGRPRDGSVGIAYGLVIVVTLVWACLAKEALRLSRVLRLISAALLLALAVGHVIAWRSTMTDSIGWVVDAIIAAIAVTMAGSAVVPAFRRR